MGGFDYKNMVEKPIRDGRSRAMVGQCVGPIEHKGPITIDHLTFLKKEADRPIKVTLPGPLPLPTTHRILALSGREGERAGAAFKSKPI